MSSAEQHSRGAAADLRQSVVHEWDPEQGLMCPVWLLIDAPRFDWSKTLVVALEAPFESTSFDDPDEDVLTLVVPDHVYVRHDRQPGSAAIAMPMLAEHARRLFAVSPEPPLVDDIGRLLLRMADIEDMLIYEPNKIRERQ